MSIRRSSALAALLLVACHYRPTPVPVQGEPAAIEALAGDWTGSYAGDQSGRSGSITFRISEHGDSAFGDVLMVPAQGIGPRPVDVPAEHLRHARSPQSLAIRFVALVDHRVRGTLEPYVAPDCECRVHTTFTGTVSGDVVAGTFVTRSDDGLEQTGRWRVTRKRD
ncbi:MAG: hypothetical protein KGL38_03320 [Gemmatimonadota bacterium]|nr:hypothetical protein [Gemmatimonadota bacterium]MDE3173889.1 hypothetical protein [Gemmatimonadota bacterium]MDE3215787.1 hypothetical protein [Gemmatimonadota bacterium]